jgi:hypothetical protein
MIKVYVAGPYSSNPAAGLRNALKCAEVLRETKVLLPFVPHLCLMWDVVYDHEYQWWIDFTSDWLRQCDCLVRLPGDSPGSDHEWNLAKQLGMPCWIWTGEKIACEIEVHYTAGIVCSQNVGGER